MTEAGASNKLNEWQGVRFAFVADLVDIAAALANVPVTINALSIPDILSQAKELEFEIPNDIVNQALLSDEEFKQFLTDKIQSQTDLLMHAAGQDFLTEKIISGLMDAEVEDLYKDVFLLLLRDPEYKEDKKLFYGRWHYLVTRPIA